jgi:hypothetical protein
MAEVSPTGKPMLQLPAWLTMVVAGLAAIAGIVPMIPGLPPWATAAAGAVISIAAALGVVSPGARQAPPPAPVTSPAQAAQALELPPK